LTNYEELTEREVTMAGSDLLKNTAARHHGKHHGNTVPDTHSNDGNSKRTHKDDKQGHHKEEKQPKGRKTAMKTRIAQTLTGLAFSVMLIGFAPNYKAEAATLANDDVVTFDVKNLDAVRIDDVKASATDKLGNIKDAYDQVDEVRLDADKEAGADNAADTDTVADGNKLPDSSLNAQKSGADWSLDEARYDSKLGKGDTVSVKNTDQKLYDLGGYGLKP
jgi:hypothetical protein